MSSKTEMLNKLEQELENYKGRYWNSHAGDYDYDDILLFFKNEVESETEWKVDGDGNIFIIPKENEEDYTGRSRREQTEAEMNPFFSILGEGADPKDLNL